MGVGFTFGGCKQSGLRDGWVSHVEDVRNEFERTGKCPSVVPSEVAMLDGTLYTPHPFAFDTSGPETDAIALFTANVSSLYFNLDVKTKARDLSCADAGNAFSSQFDEYLDPLPLLQDEISVIIRDATFLDRVEALPLFVGSSKEVGGGGV